MNAALKLVSIVLLATACGRPRVSAESSTDADSTSTGETSTSESSTESSTSDSETSGPEPTTEEGPSFVMELDLPPPVNQCDPFTQDCPDGEKCVPYRSTGGNWDAHKCVPVLGDQAIGEPCTYDGTVEATDNCDENGACWDVTDVNGEAIGICTPFCMGTADEPECPPGLSCLIGNFSPALCIGTCDPTLQDCQAGFACYWANNGFNCVFTGQNLPPGEPCVLLNDCAAGNPCVVADVLPSCVGESCCSQWCEIGDDQPCEVLPGTTCVPFFEEGMAPPGYENVGVCILP